MVGMNRVYENQNLLYIVPLIRHTIVVCVNSISPIVKGCFICVNINIFIVLNDINNFVMSGGILSKMLILGMNEMASCLSSEVLKGYSLFLILLGTKHNTAGYTPTGEYRHNLKPHTSMLPQHQSVT